MHMTMGDSPLNRSYGKTSTTLSQNLTRGDTGISQKKAFNEDPLESRHHVYSKIHSGAVGSRTTTLFLSRATTKISNKERKTSQSYSDRKLEKSFNRAGHDWNDNEPHSEDKFESELERLVSQQSIELSSTSCQKDPKDPSETQKEESCHTLALSNQDLSISENASVPTLAREFTRMLTFADTTLDISDIKGIQHNDKKHLKETQEEKQYTKMYTEACQLLRVIPVSQVIRNMMGPAMELQRYSLGPRGMKSVVISLVNNVRVTRLNAAENDLGVKGAVAIAELMLENNYITELVLSSNDIRSEGAKAICDAVKSHSKLRTLNLSHNQLGDQDACHIAGILRGKCTLQELNISNNQFREQGGITIGKAIALNDKLQTLDLSWNHLRGKGGVGICRGLQENVGLRKLNLSWNGLGREGGQYLAHALASNRTLEHLDVANNRLSTEDMGVLLKGLQHNDCLQVLKIGANPFSSEMAFSLLQMARVSDMPLRELDFKDIPVSVNFQALATHLHQDRGLKVRHGAVILGRSSKQKPKRNNEMTANPLKIFFTHLSKQGMRVIDLYKRFDTGKRDHLYVTKQQFRDGISSINIPLLSGGVEQIVDKIEAKNETVDLVLLFEEEKQFRKKLIQNRTQKPPKPPPSKQQPGKTRKLSTLEKQDDSPLSATGQTS
ncbi:leucine-rich repeat-containing protein 74A [Lingula anatina]|uniref:Leucine-rich repeat-containing protein 74A n=1 Tax=Lingula anatina TaxID=7574 RepID=A0A1S3H143_LINAN|nr:leucine-rich repeat-containing protein 74A [Lingula anatina]|eukprot:XP_013379728.1 leucine-rich repeat-containing protein 74A [Lingula anatina]